MKILGKIIEHFLKALLIIATLPLEGIGYIAHWIHAFLFIGWCKAERHMNKLADNAEKRVVE